MRLNDNTSRFGPAFPGAGQAPAISLALVVLLCIAWILPGLVGHDPWKPDEAYSFGLVWSILKGGDWVVPTLAGEPFMEKPPLFYLAAAAFARLFSPWLPLHDGARLASGFGISLALIFSGLAGRELWGKGYGRITALVMIGCLGLVVRTHQLITDVGLLAGFAVAIYGLALARRTPLAGGIILGTGVGISFMAKGLLGPCILGITALLLPLFCRAWRSRGYAGALGIALLVALPWLAVWPYALYQRSPALFREWFWVNNFGRYAGFAHLGADNETGYYFKTLPWFAWPALPLALWVLWRGGLNGLRAPAVQLPLIAFLVMLAVLSTASDARDVYALPFLLPLSLLATASVDNLRRGAARALDWFGVMTFGLIAAVLWAAWLALMTGHPAGLAERAAELQPGYVAPFQWFALVAAAAYTLVWLAVVIRMPRSNLRALTTWALGLTLMWGLSGTLLLPWLDAGKSYRAMVVSMRQAMPARYTCVASVRLGEPQRGMLDYFGGILTKRVEAGAKREDCDLLLMQGGAAEENTGPGWQKIWEGGRLGDRSERFRLFRKL